ncbi:unnamed protein product [Ambrosiozyma monospora]|uniref:Unnamed protein product n=1 Tax=Ambrosiozyma monospora TaxID=43982 RepID=A0ACB5T757_AMBMO|nr:unnamed protein product [Ambrosiozyma monospora]
MTYKVIAEQIGIVRLYLFPEDSKYIDTLNWFRNSYNKMGIEFLTHNRFYKRIIRNLVTVVDYSRKAWNLIDANDLLVYILKNDVLLFNSVVPTENWTIASVSKTQFIQCNQEADFYAFHVSRMKHSKPYMKFQEKPLSSKQNIREDVLLRERLVEVYNNVRSPEVNYDLLKAGDETISEELSNNRIAGFKSQLYLYQLRSVSKMIEKELYPRTVLMPNIVATKNGFFDLQSLNALRRPIEYTTPKGGILAENMGLGKTCICLALICISKFQIVKSDGAKYTAKRNPVSLFDNCIRVIKESSLPWRKYEDVLPENCTSKLRNDPAYVEKKMAVSNNKRRTRGSISEELEILNANAKKIYLSSTTLVVIPNNLFHQWRLEIKKHVEDGYLKVLELPLLKSKMPKSAIEVLDYDVVLISMTVFSKQAEKENSLLKSVYWKRLIIDEGHSMNNKTTRAVQLAKELSVERKWTITGTPTSGLTNLNIEQEENDYTVKEKFDTKDDLAKLGLVVTQFLKIEPWHSDSHLWTHNIINPFRAGQFNSDVQLGDYI